MWIRGYVGIVVMLASLVPAAALPATAGSPATAGPVAGLHYLVGAWKCTYRSGTASMAYDATFAYDLQGHALRQIASWQGGGDEELLAYDAKRGGWSVVELDRVSATEYTLHATARYGGKTVTSVDT
jgi:hypothetical protein